MKPEEYAELHEMTMQELARAARFTGFRSVEYYVRFRLATDSGDDKGARRVCKAGNYFYTEENQ